MTNWKTLCCWATVALTWCFGVFVAGLSVLFTPSLKRENMAHIDDGLVAFSLTMGSGPLIVLVVLVFALIGFGLCEAQGSKLRSKLVYSIFLVLSAGCFYVGCALLVRHHMSHHWMVDFYNNTWVLVEPAVVSTAVAALVASAFCFGFGLSGLSPVSMKGEVAL